MMTFDGGRGREIFDRRRGDEKCFYRSSLTSEATESRSVFPEEEALMSSAGLLMFWVLLAEAEVGPVIVAPAAGGEVEATDSPSSLMEPRALDS